MKYRLSKPILQDFNISFYSMAAVKSMLETSDEQSAASDAKENVNASTSTTCNHNDSKQEERLRCFVCDVRVQGRYYALATCKTQNTRSKVIDKLGELVGERYMVVIAEDDIICRSCASLINTLDKLESEMRIVRDNILRYLEQKYSLEEGELLVNSDRPKLCQPPQITKCDVGKNIEKKKSKGWIQCNKCKYTTHHSSFMIYHMRNRIKQKDGSNKCNVQSENGYKNSHDSCMKEQKSFDEGSVNNSTLRQSLEAKVSESYLQPQISNQHANIPFIGLPNSGNMNIQNILTSDEPAMSCQPLYVRVLQQIDANEELIPPLLTATNSETEMVVKLKGPAKQMLTLGEDGNFEMVEVDCWNDMQSNSDIHFS